LLDAFGRIAVSAGAFTSAVLVLYGMVGIACCVAARNATRSRSWGDVAFAFALWPLWLPLWLGAQKPSPVLPGAAPEAHPATASLLTALARVQGSPLAPLLPDQAAVRGLAAKLADVSVRIEELDEVLSRPTFDLDAALARRDEMARDPTSTPPGALASATLRVQNIERLRELRSRFVSEVDEINELLSQLVIQVEVVRFAGSADDGTRDLLRELLLRVEGLGQMLDDRSAPLLSRA
jgi:hypothetical protein